MEFTFLYIFFEHFVQRREHHQQLLKKVTLQKASEIATYLATLRSIACPNCCGDSINCNRLPKYSSSYYFAKLQPT